MKKLLCWALTAALLLALLPSGVSAENAQFLYTGEDITELYYDYEYVADLVETHFGPTASFAYRTYTKDHRADQTAETLINWALDVIDETPDKKYYTQILVNMIALMEYDLADQVENQSQFDNMQTIGDHICSVADIAVSAVGMGDEVKGLSEAIKVLDGTINLLEATVDEIKYYELTVRNYAGAENFLKAVNEYSDNKTLREAAYDLRAANDLLVKERFRYIDGMTLSTGKFMAETYYEDLSYGLLKKTETYQIDDSIREFVDFGEAAFKALDKLKSKGEAIYKAAMLGGDILFGTTDTFRRHCEMETMADIAQAITAAYQDIDISLNKTPQALFSDIRMRCDYYKMLISTHLRGEYLIYSLVDKDAGALSLVNRWIDKFCGKQSVSEWYDGKVRLCDQYYGMVERIFTQLSQQKFVVRNGFELHNGFIVEVETQTEVPDGYIGVYTFEDFNKIAVSCPSMGNYIPAESKENEYNTANYILMNDIVFPAEYDNAYVFYGILDGNGYTMKNLNKPLFQTIGNAVIKNLSLEVNLVLDTNDVGYSYGAIAEGTNSRYNRLSYIQNCHAKGIVNITCRSGNFGGLIGGGSGCSITNCYNESSISVKTRQGGSLGGISGNKAAISNCYNNGALDLHATCEMTISASTIEASAGGIQGEAYGNSVSNCYNTGSVHASSPIGNRVYCGGILGDIIPYSQVVRVENCYNIGVVSSEWAGEYDPNKEYSELFSASYCTGGIVGYIGGYNTYITKCWNAGTVSGELFTGGILGMSDSDEFNTINNCYNTGSVSGVQYAGGILGKDVDSTGIENCYSIGTVSQALHCGALAGAINDGERNLRNCYYLEGTGNATAVGVKYSGTTALTQTQFGDMACFEGFDFLEIWKLREDDTTPQLR